MDNSAIEQKAADTEKLWIRYKKNGDRGAKDELLLHYMSLVRWVVRRMMPKYNNYNEYDDLVSSGVIGLIDAVDKFDTGFGVKFETYAATRIRGEILDYMRSQDWAPPSLRKKISAISEVLDSLDSKLDEGGAERLVAERLDMPVANVQKIIAQTHMWNLVNFEDSLNFSFSAEDIRSPDESTPESVLLEKEQKKALAELIDALPEKERYVITMYYYEGMLLKEIADALNVTESRVSQIHSKVLAKMRQKLM
jgi:RNA polymerase sigma factor for flagellar operon FliA